MSGMTLLRPSVTDGRFHHIQLVYFRFESLVESLMQQTSKWIFPHFKLSGIFSQKIHSNVRSPPGSFERNWSFRKCRFSDKHNILWEPQPGKKRYPANTIRPLRDFSILCKTDLKWVRWNFARTFSWENVKKCSASNKNGKRIH